MVPSSLGCGVSVLAAIATLAPSAAARSAIASPMPRDAPVMNRVLPLSDIASPFACKERLERGFRFWRLQPRAEDLGLLVNARQDLVRLPAHQRARGRNRARRQRRDLARRLEGLRVDVLGRDHDIGDTVLLGV